jgi:signal transduction histidine kinase
VNARLRVLVVDDEPGMRLGAQRVLRKCEAELPDIDLRVGFDVEVAADGREALAKLETAAFDLVLLDYKLPDMTGLDILGRIAGRKLDVCVVMITAFASLDVAVSATKNGAFDFLAKPFSPEELEATARKAARSLLLQREARRLAEEKRRVRFEFLRVLSHELKAPLGAVESYLVLLRDRVAGEDLKAYDLPVRRAIERVEGMRKLILDLLDLTRIESGERRRDLRDVDLVEVARSAIELAAAEAKRRGVAIEVDAPERLPVRADRSEMEIVLNNLVSNAVKYNRDGGRVGVRLARGADGLEIAVSDTGIGMAPEECAKLFGEFVRIRNDQTRGIPGSGLGLSTVRKLATLYGGTVAVQSRPGVGSTFTVRLPAAPSAPAGGATP